MDGKYRVPFTCGCKLGTGSIGPTGSNKKIWSTCEKGGYPSAYVKKWGRCREGFKRKGRRNEEMKGGRIVWSLWK